MVAATLCVFTMLAVSAPQASAEKIDPAEVQKKIAALAVADETAPYNERAENWLANRRAQIMPQLIAGLNGKSPRIAEKCLDILWSAPASKELTDALIDKVNSEYSPLRYKALRKLEASAADPRVAAIFDRASLEDLPTRARWAWLARQNDRAVEILRPLVGNPKEMRGEVDEAIRLLGKIGGPESVKLLEPIAAGNHWGMAAEAYRALAKCDSKNHGLTKDQETLLKNWHSFKESEEHFNRRMTDLAKQLNQKECRPFVMQMLHDEEYAAPHAGLSILAAWKDKESLPQIRELLQHKRSFTKQRAIATYLTIDDSPRAEKDVLDLLTDNESSDNEVVLRGIMMAKIPTDRKIEILHAAEAKLKSHRELANTFRGMLNGDDAGRDVLTALMDAETDLSALGQYCGIAAQDKQKRLSVQVRRAMKLLTADVVASAGDNPQDGKAQAVATIIGTVAAYDLKDLAPNVQKFMDCRNPTIRSAALQAGAKLGVAEALKRMYAQLESKDAMVRRQAAATLAGLAPLDEADRADRESAVLALLGTPSEDCAMQILVTCGREKTVKALTPILDDPNPQRAVHAAWVMAQLPDKTAAAKGLRRVAIFGLFNHQIYQQGAGIDFSLAPELYFHQVTERLNPDPKAYSAGEGPVRIPKEWLIPFAWDDTEQQYAVRCYRYSEVSGTPYCFNVGFLRASWMGPHSPPPFDQTHLPLLREIAAHDSHIDRVMVQGHAVAHFLHRQMAARAVAAVTKEKAGYIGLAGETLDSAAFPQPYKNQDELLAKFIVDRVEKARLPANPESDRQWSQSERYRIAVSSLKEKLGPQVLDAIRREAERRHVDMNHILPTQER